MIFCASKNVSGPQELPLERPIDEDTEGGGKKEFEAYSSFGSFKLFDKQVLVRELMQDLSETEKDFMWRRHVEGKQLTRLPRQGS